MISIRKLNKKLTRKEMSEGKKRLIEITVTERYCKCNKSKITHIHDNLTLNKNGIILHSTEVSRMMGIDLKELKTKKEIQI